MRPSQYIIQNTQLQLTDEQDALLQQLDDFILEKKNTPAIFIIKGYAGTGKTMLISQMVQVLKHFALKVALLAPTGRAAKVLSNYANKPAYTIHKRIYRQTNIENGNLVFKKVSNKSENTVFIVDEASMISDKADYGQKSLLNDLFTYVFSGSNNKLILIGDTAQLPPVGDLDSPALDADYVEKTFQIKPQSFQLTQVMRQTQRSGILRNATHLRNQISQEVFQFHFRTKGFADFYKMTADRLEDGLRYAYEKFGVEQTIVVCRSNKNANNFNQYIRRMIRFCESEIESGDLLMIVKNNYFVLPAESPATFLANGDFVEVLKISHLEEEYGFRFATLLLRLLDEPNQEPFEAKVLLDVLHSASPSLTQEAYQQLHEAVEADYMDITQKKKRNEALKKDPYLNALQVKFAYALTCHKSQGGQWDAVFVEQGYLTDENINLEFLRWLYTAITRATKNLFLVNFHERFFEEE